MPQIKSAKKRQRQTEVRTLRNRTGRSELRTAIKNVRQATTKDQAAKALAQAEILIDRAAGKKLIHHNAADRHKSRLHKAVSALG